MTRHMSVAAIQTSYGDDLQANIDKTIGFIREAAQLYQLPEAFLRAVVAHVDAA